MSCRVAVLGGGEAGRTVLNALDRADRATDAILIEPARHRFDQPAWLRVGTEGLSKEQTRSDVTPQIPASVTWVQERVTSVDPGDRIVTTDENTTVRYDCLVIAVGTRTHWDRIRGLHGHLGTDGICSVYGYEQAERTWELIRSFEGGRALFTAPSTPHKGGPAPLTVLRQAEARWRETDVYAQTEIVFATALSPEFAGETYAELIERDPPEEKVHVYTGYDLIEVRPDAREAVFAVTKGESRSKAVLPYDLLHVVPPMRPAAFLEDSELVHHAGPMKGYLDVDPESLRHRRFETVFGVGDVLGIEGVKTAERAREQATEVAHVLIRLLDREG